MEIIFEQEIPRKELVFESDADKFAYLDGKLSFYTFVGEAMVGASEIEYNLNITRPDGARVYSSGAKGKPGKRFCGSNEVIPYTKFVQDLVFLRAILGVEGLETPEADEFNKNILEYLIELDNRGVIPHFGIRIEGMSTEKMMAAFAELPFEKLQAPVTFVSVLQKAFREVYEPKIRQNTGDYDSNNLVESSWIKVYE
jgi:hypothetical protein